MALAVTHDLQDDPRVGGQGHAGRGRRGAARSVLATPAPGAIPARRDARPQATAAWLPALQRLKRQVFQEGKA